MATINLSGVAADVTAAVINRLASGGSLRVYDGEVPDTVDEIPDSRPLIDAPLLDPAFGTAEDGEIRLADVGAIRVRASGNPSWFRVLMVDGRTVFQGLVGPGRALSFDRRRILAGDIVRIDEFVYVVRKS